MAWTEFTHYTALYPAAKGTLADKRIGLPLPVVLPIYGVVPASPGAAPTVAVCKAPAGFKPLLVDIRTDGLSISAGVGLTAALGDSGDIDRLVVAQDFDAAASYTGLAAAGFNYEYTAETTINLTINTGKTPVATKIVSGFILGAVRQ